MKAILILLAYLLIGLLVVAAVANIEDEDGMGDEIEMAVCVLFWPVFGIWILLYLIGKAVLKIIEFERMGKNEATKETDENTKGID